MTPPSSRTAPVPPTVPPIDGDAELLTQLCANLVENAMRHSPAGARIVVSAERQAEHLVLVCADDGPGIPESERAKVFQRLYRIDKSRTTPGNGLGLSLVKAIAELHRAEVILADNSPGLRVTIGFPMLVPARSGPGRTLV